MKNFYTALLASVFMASCQVEALGIPSIATKIGSFVVDEAKLHPEIKDQVVNGVKDHAIDAIPYGRVVVPIAQDVIKDIQKSSYAKQASLKNKHAQVMGSSNLMKTQDTALSMSSIVKGTMSYSYESISHQVKEKSLSDLMQEGQELLIQVGHSNWFMTYLKSSMKGSAPNWRDSLKDAAEAKVKEQIQDAIEDEENKLIDRLEDHETQVDAIGGFLNEHLSDLQKEQLQTKMQELEGVIAMEELTQGSDNVKNGANSIVGKVSHDFIDFETVHDIAKTVSIDADMIQ